MILKYPHKKLRTVSKSVKKIDKFAIKESMKLYQAAKSFDNFYHPIFGLAANQVGITKRIILLKQLFGKFIIMINPEFTATILPFLSIDRCFSLPSVVRLRKRYFFVKIRYLDLNGINRQIWLFGPTAFFMQQEIYYLDGKLIID